MGYHNEFITKAPVIVIGRKGSVGKLAFSAVNGFPIDTTFFVDTTKNDVHLKYLYYIFEMIDLESLSRKMGVPGLNRNDVYDIKIPLPPLDVQQKIVAEFDALEQEERQVSVTLSQQSELMSRVMQQAVSYPKSPLSHCVKVRGGKRLPVGESFSSAKTDYPYIRVSDFKEKSVDTSELKYITKEQHGKIKNYTINSTDVYISIAGTLGIVGKVPDVLDGANLTENAAKLMPDNDKILRDYLLNALNSEDAQTQITNVAVGLGTPKLSLERINSLIIPLPPLDKQREIVAEMEQIEAEIAAQKARLAEMKEQKEGVLKKYL